MNLHILDLLVLVIYFCGMLALGLYVGRGNRSTEGYFLGDRSFSGWAVGISMLGSIISSVTFLAVPADGFKTAWLRFVPNLAFPLVAVLAATIFIPFFRRGTITSAYEYLDKRFGASVSGYVASIFLITQLVRTSCVVYLLAILMQSIIGWGFYSCLLLTAGVTAIYTIKGGLKAVIWTDVVQTFILVIGALASIGVIIALVPGGLSAVFEQADKMNKLSFWDLDSASGTLVPTKWGVSFSEKTVLMLIVAGFFQYLNVQLDQSTVQRWCSARTAREAKQSAYILGFGAIPIWACFQFLGTCLFVFFLHFPATVPLEILAGVRKTEEIMPFFIVHHLPNGVSGIVIAGALAAAMSTLSACINAASMVWVQDLYGRFLAPGKSDQHYLYVGKATAILVSLGMILGASVIHAVSTVTLTDLLLTVSAILSTGVPGIFLAGMFTRRISQNGAWWGIFASIAFLAWTTLGSWGALPPQWRSSLSPYYTAIAGNIVTFIIAFLASLPNRESERDLKNLTVWDQSRSPLV